MKAKVNQKFKKWLMEKYAPNADSIAVAVQKFAADCDPVVSYNTVLKWVEGAKPRAFFCSSLVSQFPDCPLFVTPTKK